MKPIRNLNFSEFVWVQPSERVIEICKTCNHNWEPAYYTLREGYECPRCKDSDGAPRKGCGLFV